MLICIASPWYSHLPCDAERAEDRAGLSLMIGGAHQHPCSSPTLTPEVQLLEACCSSAHGITCEAMHASLG